MRGGSPFQREVVYETRDQGFWHLDLTPLARNVTWGNAVGGLLFWGLGTGVVFAFGAWLYNRVAGGTA